MSTQNQLHHLVDVPIDQNVQNVQPRIIPKHCRLLMRSFPELHDSVHPPIPLRVDNSTDVNEAKQEPIQSVQHTNEYVKDSDDKKSENDNKDLIQETQEVLNSIQGQPLIEEQDTNVEIQNNSSVEKYQLPDIHLSEGKKQRSTKMVTQKLFTKNVK
ncbi:Uncharacterized protein QTN25_007093 [Entamoeba marina]